MKRILILILLLSSTAFADDASDKGDQAKHDICQRHPPGGPYSKLEWPAGFESCKESEKAWVTSQAKKKQQEQLDRAELEKLNKPSK